MDRIKNLLRWLVLIVGLYGVAELFSWILLWGFFSTFPSSNKALIESYYQQGTDIFYSKEWYMHPYLGFKSPKGAQGIDEVALPKPTNEFWVGILGGSLAEMFVVDVPAKERLETHLQMFPAAKNKKVRVIHMAHSGYKQPQQTIAYTLFGEKLDLVINIEGFNEVSNHLLGADFPLSYPLTSFRHYYSRWPGYVYLLSSKIIVETIFSSYFGYLENSSIQKSPLVTLSLLTGIKILGPINSHLQLGFLNYYKKERPDRPDPWSLEAIRARIAIWEVFARKQILLAQASGVPIWIFLQPNQYLENRKPITEWEKKNAFNDHFAKTAPHYQLLVDKGVALAAENLPIVDLSHMFKNINATIYKDSCCHINSLGNLILADTLAENILRHPVDRFPIPEEH